MAFFSNTVTLIVTFSLVLHLTILGLLIFGYRQKKRFKFRQHGITMSIALLVHVIAIFSIMVPSFVAAVIPQYILLHPFDIISVTGLLHAILGTVAAMLGGWFVAAWHFKKDLTGCSGKRRQMRLTIIIWIAALLLGILLYYLFNSSLLMG
jgi:hypothetical protein